MQHSIYAVHFGMQYIVCNVIICNIAVCSMQNLLHPGQLQAQWPTGNLILPTAPYLYSSLTGVAAIASECTNKTSGLRSDSLAIAWTAVVCVALNSKVYLSAGRYSTIALSVWAKPCTEHQLNLMARPDTPGYIAQRSSFLSGHLFKAVLFYDCCC